MNWPVNQLLEVKKKLVQWNSWFFNPRMNKQSNFKS